MHHSGQQELGAAAVTMSGRSRCSLYGTWSGGGLVHGRYTGMVPDTGRVPGGPEIHTKRVFDNKCVRTKC